MHREQDAVDTVLVRLDLVPCQELGMAVYRKRNPQRADGIGKKIYWGPLSRGKGDISGLEVSPRIKWEQIAAKCVV